jgi:hypothetical protein
MMPTKCAETQSAANAALFTTRANCSSSPLKTNQARTNAQTSGCGAMGRVQTTTWGNTEGGTRVSVSYQKGRPIGPIVSDARILRKIASGVVTPTTASAIDPSSLN